jgi:multisubunit Na+/H+ antiporter MnhE subunit
VAEAWAAVSVGLMLFSFVGIALLQAEHLILGLVLSIAVFAFVEAGFRGRLTNLVSSANVALAVVAVLVLVYEFFWQLVVAAVLVVGLYVLADNLRELLRR